MLLRVYLLNGVEIYLSTSKRMLRYENTKRSVICRKKTL